jgi:glycopeptide antibiotics resistance protein
MRSNIKKISLIAYIVFAIAITQLPINLSLPYIGFKELKYNLIPFYCFKRVAEIFNLIANDGYSMKSYFFILKDNLQNFFLNMLFFVPFGCLLSVNMKKSNVLKIVLGSFLFSLVLEIMQVIEIILSLTNIRVFDIDDIIANMSTPDEF